MKKRRIALFLIAFCSSFSWGQNAPWSLSQCIEYAINNNISVKKTELNQQTAEINHQQAKNNRLPSLNANASANLNNGSAINQITNERVSRRTFSNNFGLTASVSLYEGNKLHLQVERSGLLLSQNELYVQEAKNNITLSVLEAYVQALFLNEGIIIAQNTANSSAKELELAQQKFENGAIAKLNLAEVETKHANNQYAIIKAKNDFDAQVLKLKQLLELPSDNVFNIALDLKEEDFVAILPDKNMVFESAIQTLPNIKIYQTQQEIAQKDIEIAKAGYLPTLNLQAGINSGYSNINNYNYRTQLDTNFGQTIGLSLQIPIFSQYKNRNNIKLAQISKLQAGLEQAQANKDLYAKIETAWQNASSYQAQQQASKIACDNAKLAYELAQKKYEFGTLTNTELLVSENTYLNAEQTYRQNKYMSALYHQLLQFYQGNTIQLGN